ncbi:MULTISPECIES: hypothetical protein [Rhizobium]|uniref:hypothetical protein n=1 Tax=Rhizobium TaxID=379 RepID=UPI00026ECB98|nr:MULTISPECIES: hypothetical protein [Rhizobium]EJK87282.1 hypothetical protein PMI03_01293 [Rhizobium sp. AP16]MDJ1632223.1 hypothetical protein [Rhizobium rhizogenes]NTG73519.1 hypothetical protein [Rhizobium rhizogenes]
MFKIYSQAFDGSIYDETNKTIFFSFEKFQSEICKEGHCFVCGAKPDRAFNDEHVFPNWLQRYCNIQKEGLDLPNGQQATYATYKIACCSGCNSLLGDVYETPISEIIKGGQAAVVDFVQNGGMSLFCGWLSLIFLKVHLRDFRNRVSLDLRAPAETIGDSYELHELHHVHAVARAVTAGVEIDPDVLGTLMILDVGSHAGLFDYCDNLAGRTLLLQVNNMAFVYVIDDCGATSTMLRDQMKVLPHPLNRIQVREVYARHLTANMHIASSPTFGTVISTKTGKPRITVDLPEFKAHDFEPKVFGEMFRGSMGNLASEIEVDGKRGEAAIEIIATGRISSLVDDQGNPRNST